VLADHILRFSLAGIREMRREIESGAHNALRNLNPNVGDIHQLKRVEP